MPDELLQCFDEEKRPTQARLRSEVKTEPFRWWCGVATIWLVSDRGELMVSRRSETVSANAGKWQSYFGGHVEPERSFLETAQKELAEEAGLDVSADRFVHTESNHNEEKKSFSERYAVRWNGAPSDLHFVDGEVSEAKWMSMEEAWEHRQRFPDVWCNDCAPEEQAIIRARLFDEVL